MKSILEKIIWLSAALLFIGLPLSKGLISIGIVALIFSSSIYVIFVERPKTAKHAYPVLILGSFYFFYLMSLSYSTNIHEGWHQVLHQHGFVTIPLIFWILWNWMNSKISWLLDVFSFSCLAGCLITLSLYLLPETSVRSLTETFGFLQSYPNHVDRLKFGLYSPFIDRLHFSYLLGFSILYELYRMSQANRIGFRIINPSIFLISIILLGARGAQISLLIALSIGIFVYCFFKIKNQNLSKIDFQQRLTVLIALIIAMTIVLPIFAYKNIPALQKRYDQMTWELKHIQSGDYLEMDYENFTTLTRLRALQNARQLIRDNPFLGVGIGDFNDSMIVANKKFHDRVPVHNQNFFLYLWAAGGIACLITFILSLGNYFVKIWRFTDYKVKCFALSYIIFVISCSMMDVIWIFQIGNLSLPLFLCSIFLISKKSPSLKPQINEDTPSLL